MPKRRQKTAAEFVRELEADPEYTAQRHVEDAATEALARACADDEAELLAGLRAIGVAAASVYDFVNNGGAPVAAVPLLVAHLETPHHPRIWEGIVRSLSVRHARSDALPALRRAYLSEADPSRRWLIANAIGSMATLAEVCDLKDISTYRALFRQSRKPGHVPPAP